jgi:nucleotide-binding universal stress UspA family protein
MSNPFPLIAATDFSAPARHAAERAALVARTMGAPLALLHVLPGRALDTLRQWLGDQPAVEQQLLAEAQRSLVQLAEGLRSADGQAPSTLCRTGRVADEIGRQVDALVASLLVIGAQGAGLLRRLPLGTTAERLLWRATRPLLVVRSAPLAPYRRVLVALDDSPGAPALLAQARALAPQAHLVLLQVFQVPFEDKLQFAGVDAATVATYRQRAHDQALRQLQQRAREAGLAAAQWTACVIEGDAAQRIVEQEQVQDCDLVALGKQGRSAAEDLLLGSVTLHVLAEGRIDVLVCPPQPAGRG